MNAAVLVLTLYLTTAVVGSFIDPMLAPFHARGVEYVNGAVDGSDRAAYNSWMNTAVRSTQGSSFFPVRSSASCKVNLCYAFDGSGSIGYSGFKAEKDFAQSVNNNMQKISRGDARISGAQYALDHILEFPLTDNVYQANRAIEQMRYMNGPRTNTGGGMLECGFALWRKKKEARHIVLLTDGNANIGPDGVKVAEALRGAGMVVSVVAAGNPNERVLQELAGPNGKIYRVNSFEDAAAMARVSVKLVQELCN